MITKNVAFLNKLVINGYQGWDEILMITPISSKKLEVYKIMRNTVHVLCKYDAD